MTTQPVARKLKEWNFTAVDARQVTPRMMRVTLHCPDLEGFSYAPGQALRIAVRSGPDCAHDRDYTIRDIDRPRQQIIIDVLLHGDTPGPQWARNLRSGDPVLARGPRSPIRLWEGRVWYLLAGDETALPAILHMLESLPQGAQAQAFIEISSPEDRMNIALPEGAAICWIIRDDAQTTPSPFVQQVLGWERPSGQGQACVIGETGTVQAIRRGLIADGMAKSDIAAEGYWRVGRCGGTIERLE